MPESEIRAANFQVKKLLQFYLQTFYLQFWCRCKGYTPKTRLRLRLRLPIEPQRIINNPFMRMCSLSCENDSDLDVLWKASWLFKFGPCSR